MTQSQNTESGDLMLFGVYDPDKTMNNSSPLSLRHLYLSWVDFDYVRFQQEISSLRKSENTPLITVEPWPEDPSERDILNAIVKGEYDAHLENLCRMLAGVGGTLYLSWGHEMDQDLLERYPWSGKSPTEYVEAYRYVVNFIRERVQADIRWVWAAVMKEGSLRYWPGDEYVDFVGMPIYSFPQWDWKNYGYIRDFSETFEEKLKLLSGLKKPVLITELGVCGSQDFKSYWLRKAFLDFDAYPPLEGVIFFNSKDTEGAWGEDYSTPDWTLQPELIESLVVWKLKQRARVALTKSHY